MKYQQTYSTLQPCNWPDLLSQNADYHVGFTAPAPDLFLSGQMQEEFGLHCMAKSQELVSAGLKDTVSHNGCGCQAGTNPCSCAM